MKTMKNYIWMAAATMMAATLGACSNNDITAIETPIQKGNVVTLTATLSPKGGDGVTRALTDNGTTIGSAWAVNEEICVEYTNADDDFVDAKGIITAVDGDGKATVSVNLVNPKDGNTDIYFHYPYSIAKGIKDLTADQIGTLDDIAANFDDFDGDGILSVSAGVAKLPSDVTMTRNVSIWKLAFKVGDSDITNTITALNINISDGAREYDVTPSALDAIYVALGAVSSTNVTITAATPSGIYSYTKDEVTLDPGYFYRSTVTLTAAAASGTYRIYSDRITFDNEAIPGGATTVTSGTTTWTGDLVVSGSVTITGDVHLTGNTNLILKDGASLTVNGCIFGGADYDHGFVYALNIYGQELSTGKLTIDYSGDHSLGVLTASELNIHGGVITVGGTGVYQAFEPNVFNVYHGTVSGTGLVSGIVPMGNTHFYGGNITAVGNYQAAILLPNGGKTLTISGGTINATNIGGSTAIEAVHSINISGGTINAQGAGGGINVYGESGTSLTISGGNITATSTNGPGINVVAYTDNNGLLTITGGTIRATGGDGCGAGISAENIAISGATTEIDATGGMMMEGILAMGNITMNGGTVNSYGGTNGPGFEASSITVSGGKLTAVGGDAFADSGSDGRFGIIGNITVNGGIVTATGGAKDGSGTDGLGVDDNSTISVGPGITFFEGDTPNPTSTGTLPTCTKRYVKIQ